MHHAVLIHYLILHKELSVVVVVVVGVYNDPHLADKKLETLKM